MTLTTQSKKITNADGSVISIWLRNSNYGIELTATRYNKGIKSSQIRDMDIIFDCNYASNARQAQDKYNQLVINYAN